MADHFRFSKEGIKKRREELKAHVILDKEKAENIAAHVGRFNAICEEYDNVVHALREIPGWYDSRIDNALHGY